MLSLGSTRADFVFSNVELDDAIWNYLQINVQVEFRNLENRVFKKQQSRKDNKGRQRILDGEVMVDLFHVQRNLVLLGSAYV